jgi:hypothetical protein
MQRWHARARSAGCGLAAVCGKAPAERTFRYCTCSDTVDAVPHVYPHCLHCNCNSVRGAFTDALGHWRAAMRLGQGPDGVDLTRARVPRQWRGSTTALALPRGLDAPSTTCSGRPLGCSGATPGTAKTSSNPMAAQHARAMMSPISPAPTRKSPCCRHHPPESTPKPTPEVGLRPTCDRWLRHGCTRSCLAVASCASRRPAPTTPIFFFRRAFCPLDILPSTG